MKKRPKVKQSHPWRRKTTPSSSRESDPPRKNPYERLFK